MTDDIGIEPAEPIEAADPAANADLSDQTGPEPAVETIEPPTPTQPAVAHAKRPWRTWVAVGVGALLVLLIGSAAIFGVARFVGFHRGRAGNVAAAVQRFDRRHAGRQAFRAGRAFERGGFGHGRLGRGPVGRG